MPVLAAALPVLSKDKLSYTVQLRQGVQFNDGTPFNAQAVVASYQRYITYPGSTRASDFASVDTITASGPYTVVFHLKARDSTFTGDTRTFSRRRSSPSSATNFGADPVCVGPFMFDHRVAGDNVTVIKSPYYYDQEHVYLDKIVYKPMADAAAAAAALKAGDIQVLDQVSPTELDGVRRPRACGCSRRRSSAGGASSSTSATRTAPATRRTPTWARRSHRARSCGRRSRRRSTARRSNRVVFGGLDQAELHPDPPGEHRLVRRDEGPVHAVRPEAREEARRRVGLLEPDRAPADAERDRRLRLAQFIQAQEAAVGINVVIDSIDAATAHARAAERELRRLPRRPRCRAAADPNGNIYPFLATSGLAELQRLLQPATRPDPRERR